MDYKTVAETPFKPAEKTVWPTLLEAATSNNTAILDPSSRYGKLITELHWCEGCGMLIRNGCLIVHPAGNSKALYFCDNKCYKKYKKDGPVIYGVYPAEDWDM